MKSLTKWHLAGPPCISERLQRVLLRQAVRKMQRGGSWRSFRNNDWDCTLLGHSGIMSTESKSYRLEFRRLSWDNFVEKNSPGEPGRFQWNSGLATKHSITLAALPLGIVTISRSSRSTWKIFRGSSSAWFLSVLPGRLGSCLSVMCILGKIPGVPVSGLLYSALFGIQTNPGICVLFHYIYCHSEQISS
jgi:hypothetical protein